MKELLAVGYVLIAVMFGIWLDAMDRTYGARPELKSWGLTTLCAAVWPLAAPMAMAALAVGGSSRWAGINSAVQ